MPESIERGALTEAVYYILLSLHKPMHGYGIMQYISSISDNRVNIGAGTLYGAINTLLEKGWVEPYSNDDNDTRKKEYIITNEGKKIVMREIDRLEKLLVTGKDIIGDKL